MEDSERDQIESEAIQRLGFVEYPELSEILLGIREGRYFQGRLNVSRLTLDEATVNVQGL